MLRRKSGVIEDATASAADVAEAAIEVLDSLAGDVADAAVRGARHTPFVSSRRWTPSWIVKGAAAVLIVIGVIAVISAVVSRRRQSEAAREEKLDDALADSFPASDPPSMTTSGS